ncbi:MAG TPA: EF-hand domain-containing protein [Burkholderiales bacterium]|nr:EF-hand domain-containing protein [Burkholderiales bacterium]
MKRFIALGIAAVSFAGTAAAIDYPEERGVVPSIVPPAPDETGRVNNVPAWRNLAPVSPAAPIGAAAGNTVDDFFARYDTNRDGVIDQNEARIDPDLAGAFARADANHDGVLTRDEFQNAATIAQQDRNSAAGR